MRNTASVVPLREEREASVGNARVVSASGRDVVVEFPGVTREARVAFSCLVRPEPGDVALCIADENGAWHVLAIIERPGDQGLTLSFPADATMAAERGSLNLFSNESVNVASSGGLNLFSDKVAHKSREAVMDYHDLTARGDKLQASYNSVFFIGRTINTMARQLIARAKSYIRRTEDCDQVKAGQMTRKIEGLYSMDSKRTIMVSEKDTKIDGERIFMA